jgi:phosphoribosylglycinamide formyltransferase 1
MAAILDQIKAGNCDVDVKVVLSNKADAAGLTRAAADNIPTKAFNIKDFASKEAYEQEVIKYLKEAGVELVVLAGYMRILGEGFISAFEDKIINIHPSLLPDFKGLDAQKQALDAGVKEAGCSVHFVDNTLDGGPVIKQAKVPVLDTDTADSLSVRILEQEHRIYPEVIQLYAQKKIKIKDRKVDHIS